MDTVHSEPTTPQAAQHLDKLLEFSIAKNDERLSGLLLEVINAVENRNIVASTKQHTKFFQEVLNKILPFLLSFFLDIWCSDNTLSLVH